MKLKKLIEGFDRDDDRPSLSPDEKKEILGMISEFNDLGKSLKRDGSLPDVAKRLSRMAEAAQKITLSETDDWFDSHTVKRNMDGLRKASTEFNKLAKEAYVHEQRMTALYEDMGHVFSRYFSLKDPIEEITNVSDIDKGRPHYEPNPEIRRGMNQRNPNSMGSKHDMPSWKRKQIKGIDENF